MTRRRGPDCASDLLLDRLLAGELSVNEKSTLSAHLRTCAACEARHQALSNERTVLVSGMPPFGTIYSISSKQTSSVSGKIATPRRAMPAARWALLSLAAALVVWVSARPRPAPTEGQHEPNDTSRLTRAKGEPGSVQLTWVVRRGTLVSAPSGTKPLHPGDALRFSLSTDLPGYAAVLSLDSARRFSLYQDWVPLDSGVAQLLPGAVELDGVVGAEHWYGLVCRHAWPLAELEAAIRVAPEHPAWPSDCAVDHHRVAKELP
jgi:hypothetical protein